MKKVSLLVMITFLSLISSPNFAEAETSGFPNRPIEMIVPFQMGGLLDIGVRITVDQLAKELKTPVVVVNKPGASGSTGTTWAAKAKPDGYTLLAGGIASLVSAYFFLSKLPYETHRDFLPLAYVGESPSLLVVRSGASWKNFEELIDFAKKNPGKLSYGTSGLSTTSSLNMELIKKQTGVDITRIIYGGGGESTVDILGGHVDIGYAGYPVLQPHINAKTLRPLATSKKIDALPEVPSFMEKGFNEVVVNWSGFFAPAKIPKEVYNKLTNAFDRTLANPTIIAKLTKVGFIPERKTRAEITTLLKAQYELVAKIVKAEKAGK